MQFAVRFANTASISNARTSVWQIASSVQHTLPVGRASSSPNRYNTIIGGKVRAFSSLSATACGRTEANSYVVMHMQLAVIRIIHISLCLCRQSSSQFQMSDMQKSVLVGRVPCRNALRVVWHHGPCDLLSSCTATVQFRSSRIHHATTSGSFHPSDRCAFGNHHRYVPP